MRTDEELLALFVAAFRELDDLFYVEKSPPPQGLPVEADLEVGSVLRWRPVEIVTAPAELSAIHSRIGSRLPQLYEELILQYRWLQVDIGVCRLVPNEPSPDLHPLADAMLEDPVLNQTLLPARFVRFALGPDESYDPICFDLNHWEPKTSDCPVVRIAHEPILMHDTLGQIETMFSSFRELVNAVIQSTQQ